MKEALLIARDLKMYFGGVAALRGLGLSIMEGDLQCIIGPNGAGKSTVFNILTGMLKPSSGEVYFEGRNIVGLPLHQYARLGITRKFQVPSLFESMTVRDNLSVALFGSHDRSFGRQRVEHVITMMGLSNVAEKTVGELAHGQKQWLEIGMAVMSDPKLLLLDEPTAGMTGEETQKTADLLLRFKGNLAIIVIEHDMHFVRALNSHTMVMHQGRCICEGPFTEIEHDTTVRDVYLGRQ